jgi:hypothetical protein
MEPTSTDEYLTVAEIADLLKVNQQSATRGRTLRADTLNGGSADVVSVVPGPCLMACPCPDVRRW